MFRLVLRYAIIRGVCKVLWQIAFPKKYKPTVAAFDRILKEVYLPTIKKELNSWYRSPMEQSELS